MYAESSPSVVPPLNRYIGYDEAPGRQAITRGAQDNSRGCVERGYIEAGKLSERDLDAALDLPGDDPPRRRRLILRPALAGGPPRLDRMIVMGKPLLFNGFAPIPGQRSVIDIELWLLWQHQTMSIMEGGRGVSCRS